MLFFIQQLLGWRKTYVVLQLTRKYLRLEGNAFIGPLRQDISLCGLSQMIVEQSGWLSHRAVGVKTLTGKHFQMEPAQPPIPYTSLTGSRKFCSPNKNHLSRESFTHNVSYDIGFLVFLSTT